MDIIHITSQDTNEELEVRVNPVSVEDQQGWEVRFPDGKKATILLDQHRIWKQTDGDELPGDYIQKIGSAIEQKQQTF